MIYNMLIVGDNSYSHPVTDIVHIFPFQKSPPDWNSEFRHLSGYELTLDLTRNNEKDALVDI